MIDLNIDTINILLEKMRRRRTRKQTYLIALIQNSDDQISSYHAAFSAFVNANFFYNTNQLSSNVKTASQIQNQRLHKDTLSLESKYYRQMLKHLHAVSFEQVIYTKIVALRVKKI
jgi:hypothetical protein